jgi:hypothetical protein
LVLLMLYRGGERTTTALIRGRAEPVDLPGCGLLHRACHYWRHGYPQANPVLRCEDLVDTGAWDPVMLQMHLPVRWLHCPPTTGGVPLGTVPLPTLWFEVCRDRARTFHLRPGPQRHGLGPAAWVGRTEAPTSACVLPLLGPAHPSTAAHAWAEGFVRHAFPALHEAVRNGSGTVDQPTSWGLRVPKTPNPNPNPIAIRTRPGCLPHCRSSRWARATGATQPPFLPTSFCRSVGVSRMSLSDAEIEDLLATVYGGDWQAQHRDALHHRPCLVGLGAPL